MFSKKIQIKNNISSAGIEQNLTLDPILDYLRSITKNASDDRLVLPRFVLNFIKDIESTHGSLSELTIESFGQVFEMLRHITHNLKEGTDGLIAFGNPIPDTALFATSAFYDIAESNLSFLESSSYFPFDMDFVNKTLYLLILERFYDISIVDSRLMYELADGDVRRYYQLDVDFSYVDVQCKGDLPKIDFGALRDKDMKSLGVIQSLLGSIDLKQFKFSGVSILRFIDRNREHISGKLQHMIGNLSAIESISFFSELKEILTSIAGSKHIHYSFFPILELNGFPILKSDFSKNSIFFGELIEAEKEKYQTGIFKYLTNPYTLSYDIEEEMNTADPILVSLLQRNGLQAYACIPLKHNERLTGFLEVYTKEKNKLEKSDIIKLRPFFPYFAQLANDLVVLFKSRLDTIILYNYTSIQPAVQWRFNQVAAQYLGDLAFHQKNPTLEKIIFENVYPIYGAIDVKDSSKLRNSSQYQESLTRLQPLETFIAYLERQVGIHIPASFMAKFTVVKDLLLDRNLDQFALDILSFFRDDVPIFLQEIRAQLGDDKQALNELIIYESSNISTPIGSNDSFELSLNEITKMINGELDYFNTHVQGLFPSYFETIRTDGVEYDLYIGQTITPTLVFDSSVVKEIRRQQIISMAKIAKKAGDMYSELPLPLQTTQLIFIHPHEITIGFRSDERRFDVEGSYNIRYQIIKKRIDKVLIKNSNERLVQPNSIAIVYTGQAVEEELKDNLKEVAELGLINDQYELLLLEELQGVNELRAIRVYIKQDVPEFLT